MMPERQVSRPLILPLRLYGRRTSPVRVLSMVACLLVHHTGQMADDARAATFVTDGESFDEVVLPHLDAAYRLAR